MERQRQAKWDAGNMRTVSTKLTRREFAEFWTLCAVEGKTPYAVMQHLLKAWVAKRS